MQQKIADHACRSRRRQAAADTGVHDSTAAQLRSTHKGITADQQVVIPGDGTAGTYIAFAFLYFTHLLPLPSASLTLFKIGVFGLCAQLHYGMEISPVLVHPLLVIEGPK
jgi:hypothetical protein